MANKPKWTIDVFIESAGSRLVLTDHIAWLKRDGGGGLPTVYVKISISSRGVTAEDAQAILNAMIAGLSS